MFQNSAILRSRSTSSTLTSHAPLLPLSWNSCSTLILRFTGTLTLMSTFPPPPYASIPPPAFSSSINAINVAFFMSAATLQSMKKVASNFRALIKTIHRIILGKPDLNINVGRVGNLTLYTFPNYRHRCRHCRKLRQMNEEIVIIWLAAK